VRELRAGGALGHVRDRCVDLIENVDDVVLTLETSNILVAEFVVLATDNDAKPALNGIPAVRPWSEATLSEINVGASVLIIGPGLTMVDQVLSPDRQGHAGKINGALSALPAAHRPIKAFPSVNDVPFGAELSVIALWIRRLSAAMTRDGGDWRSAINALRPHMQRLWRSMSLAQSSRLLRHGRAYWDILRHRMAPEVETRIDALRAAGRLEIMAGRISRAGRRRYRHQDLEARPNSK
jgi:uncharacterized NAD(P)/FAD-binding protein YdhS